MRSRASARERRPSTNAGASSQRLKRADLGDPTLGDWYIDKLVGAIMGEAPIGPGVCYLAANLRRHLDERAAAISTSEPRMVAALTLVSDRLAQAAGLAERIEAALGELVAVTGAYKHLAARELTRSLEILREHLKRARELELDITMRAHWEDLGVSG